MVRPLELTDSRLVDRILFSFADRRALCELALATYRVELTRTLNRMAAHGFRPGDLDLVRELARQIEGAAAAARLGAVRADAVTLETRALAASTHGKREEGATLVAGLKLIERILETATATRASDGTRGALN